ncbi:MAG: hypothetical protein Q4G59_09265, partial [Planctomycetia bacterium]|nr:hypothetical protein [Planctomycetia bacterium]
LKIWLSLLFCTFSLSLFADELVVYPEYPKQIRRDNAYSVKVVQGDISKPLVVYNHTESSILNRRQHGGDSQRRFCEFAFSGGPVQVDISVQQDVRSYTVFPASARLKSTFKNNTISVVLDRPQYFGIRLNDDSNTILSILADAPEKDVPKKGDPGVMYVDSWTDAPDRSGLITTDESVREIYIAPGAVLNAWLEIRGPNTKVHGRGMLLDPMSDIFRFDQKKRTGIGIFRVLAPNVVVDGIKLIDARGFNYILRGKGCKLRNFKALSSMMCTDGITFTSGNDPDTEVENGWLYVGDNVLVLSGSSGVHVRNVVIGTSCAAIFPQGSFKSPAYLENIDIFRCDEGLVNNYHNQTTPGTKGRTVYVNMKNLCAVDCVLFPWIFQGRNMGTLEKVVKFDTISVPQSTGVDHYNSVGKSGPAIRMLNADKYLYTDNYTLDFTNLYIAGKLVNKFGPSDITAPEKTSISVRVDKSIKTDLPMEPNRTEMNYIYPYKVVIGHSPQTFCRLPQEKDGQVFLHASELGKKLGLQESIPGEWISLNDLSKYTDVSYDRAAGKIVLKNLPNTKNLVEESCPIQSIFQRVPSWMAKLETLKDNDNLVYNLSKVNANAGMQTIITDTFLKNGNGTYELTFAAKAKEPMILVLKLLSNEKVFMQKVDLSTDWQECRVQFNSDFDLEITRLVSLGFYTKVPADNFLIRDIVFRKIVEK